MRIRTVKPEFWRSDDIDALCVEDRLLFIGLWSYVDDSGVGIDKESSIAADLFAGDLARDFSEASLRVHDGLKRLEAANLINRYAVDGRRFLHICTWTKHQKINRPTPSRYPGPTSADAPPPTPSPRPSPVNHGGLSESSLPGTGEQGNRGTRTTSATAGAAPKRDDRFDDFWGVYPRRVKKDDARRAWASVLRKKVDPDHVIQAARDHATRWQAERKETRYIPYPASWLNGGSYNDEPEPMPLRLVSAGGHTPYQNPTDQSVYDEPMFPRKEKTP